MKRKGLKQGTEVSIDEVLQLALARIYPAELAQQILLARASHSIIEVTPQNTIRFYSREKGADFSSMPPGTLYIADTAWLKTISPGRWTGLSTEPPDWKVSLVFLLLARDVRNPDLCQYFSLPDAKKYWDRVLPVTRLSSL